MLPRARRRRRRRRTYYDETWQLTDGETNRFPLCQLHKSIDFPAAEHVQCRRRPPRIQILRTNRAALAPVAADDPTAHPRVVAQHHVCMRFDARNMTTNTRRACCQRRQTQDAVSVGVGVARRWSRSSSRRVSRWEVRDAYVPHMYSRLWQGE